MFLVGGLWGEKQCGRFGRGWMGWLDVRMLGHNRVTEALFFVACVIHPNAVLIIMTLRDDPPRMYGGSDSGKSKD